MLTASAVPRLSVLLFCDLIDSSLYASYFTHNEYAKLIQDYQGSFEKLASIYFMDLENSKTCTKILIETRGDEGCVFCVINKMDEVRNVLRVAISFIMHFKIYLFMSKKFSNMNRPKRINVGAGVHLGEIIDLTDNEGNIKKIEGYAINKAKRIESASRLGENSRVMLSEAAALKLKYNLLFTKKLTASLKGIEEKENLYEIISGLYDNIRMNISPEYSDELLSAILQIRDFENVSGWERSFYVSALEKFTELPSNGHSLIPKVKKTLALLTWANFYETDPIILYKRAKEYMSQGEFTQCVRCLMELLKIHKNFIPAVLDFIYAIKSQSFLNSQPAEIIYARDLAKDLLRRFSDQMPPKDSERLERIIKSFS